LKLFDLDECRKIGGVVDYVLEAKPGASVFVIGYSDDSEDQFYMDYYKMGKGPYYLFLRPYHLCHFETPYAIQSIMKHKEPVLVQKKRVLEVGTRAKINLKKNTVLDGIGGYHTYGVLEKPNNLPIGLSKGTILIKDKKKDDPIEWEDVEFPEDDQRLVLWEEQENTRVRMKVSPSITTPMRRKIVELLH
jgi:predicted homoserine dehydrogenase-like protein